jgi:hypothetical protein
VEELDRGRWTKRNRLPSMSLSRTRLSSAPQKQHITSDKVAIDGRNGSRKDTMWTSAHERLSTSVHVHR